MLCPLSPPPPIRSYLDHQKEMGDPIIPKPVFFLKPPSAAVAPPSPGGTVEVTVPKGRGSCHYETEVVFRVGPDGGGFDAVTLGLDLTLRDEQNAAKKAGHPWEAAKVREGEEGGREEDVSLPVGWEGGCSTAGRRPVRGAGDGATPPSKTDLNPQARARAAALRSPSGPPACATPAPTTATE